MGRCQNIARQQFLVHREAQLHENENIFCSIGMGDVLTLVEKAEASIKEEDAEAMTRRMMSNKFDFNDFVKQFKMVSKMGSMAQIMSMIPGENS